MKNKEDVLTILLFISIIILTGLYILNDYNLNSIIFFNYIRYI